MTGNAFDRLAPFIQEYIYKNRWDQLREVQEKACDIIFNTDNHLLLATETASGKTEAAFLPVITLLAENPPASIGVIYIGPAKALINDQFSRLDDLLEESEIPVCSWHGDISADKKSKFLTEMRGILQITPESLESLLINHANKLGELFRDLRFVIIDEVHAFMGSERGLQILCQLERLAAFIPENRSVRRIGLSATLSNHRQAGEWLASGTGRKTSIPDIKSIKREIRLALENFECLEKSYDFILDNTKARKCIVFSNNRGEAEETAANLKQIAIARNQPDVYYVHHGSISKKLREETETAVKDPYLSAVVCATVTLELGIDIGQLDRVIQINAPHSVSGFVQRLGRSGRRNTPSEMCLVCTDDRFKFDDENLSVFESLPWSLLQSIAIIQLYLEEKWIEPARVPKNTFSLLYHQTMSVLASYGELSPQRLAQNVLTLSPFRQVRQDDYKKLLLHLLETEHLQKTAEGNLIIGLSGEREVNSFKFYAVFDDCEEYIVRDKNREIGKINFKPEEGDKFALAGKTWEVSETDYNKKTVFVVPSTEKVFMRWSGKSVEIHSRILEKIREILVSRENYPYLKENAKRKLAESRELVKGQDICNNNVFKTDDNRYFILPWGGTNDFSRIKTGLGLIYRDYPFKVTIGGISPYFLEITVPEGCNLDIEEDLKIIDTIGEEICSRNKGLLLKASKFNRFLPEDLLIAKCDSR